MVCTLSFGMPTQVYIKKKKEAWTGVLGCLERCFEMMWRVFLKILGGVDHQY